MYKEDLKLNNLHAIKPNQTYEQITCIKNNCLKLSLFTKDCFYELPACNLLVLDRNT